MSQDKSVDDDRSDDMIADDSSMAEQSSEVSGEGSTAISAETNPEDEFDPDARDYSSSKKTGDSSKKSLLKRVVFVFVSVLLFTILTGVGIAILSASQGISLMKISGSSMEPSLSDGDWVIFDADPDEKAGQIVFFHKPSEWDKYIDRDTYLVKRVVGLPNDVIEVKDNALYVSGQKKYDLNTSDYKCNAPDGYSHTVGWKEMFVVGDNYTQSLDSLRILCDGNADNAYVHPDDYLFSGHVAKKLKGAFLG